MHGPARSTESAGRASARSRNDPTTCTPDGAEKSNPSIEHASSVPAGSGFRGLGLEMMV